MRKAALGLALGFLGFSAAFFVPTHVFAASPYTDQFENFNSVNPWTVDAGTAIGTSTDCFVGACGVFTGLGVSQAVIEHKGGSTVAGGLRIYYKTNSNTATFHVAICDIYSCNDNWKLSYTDSPLDRLYHYVDMVFTTTATSTHFDSFKDGSTVSVQGGDTTATSSPVVYNTVQIGGQGGATDFVYFDSLDNEFALQQQSLADVQNQSFYIATSTVNTLCASNATTSTSFLSEVGASLSQGLCSSLVFLFVPDTTITGKFSGLSGQLVTKFPFSWYLDVKAKFAGLSTTTSSNYPDIEYPNLPITQIIAGGNLSIASSTNIQRLASDNTWNTVRMIMGFMLWIGFAYFVYHRILNIWRTT